MESDEKYRNIKKNIEKMMSRYRIVLFYDLEKIKRNKKLTKSFFQEASVFFADA